MKESEVSPIHYIRCVFIHRRSNSRFWMTAERETTAGEWNKCYTYAGMRRSSLSRGWVIFFSLMILRDVVCIMGEEKKKVMMLCGAARNLKNDFCLFEHVAVFMYIYFSETSRFAFQSAYIWRERERCVHCCASYIWIGPIIIYPFCGWRVKIRVMRIILYYMRARSVFYCCGRSRCKNND